MPFVGRGAGTGLSGGAIAVEGGVVVSFARMARILEIDVPNLRAVVQPGLINRDVRQPVDRHRIRDAQHRAEGILFEYRYNRNY